MKTFLTSVSALCETDVAGTNANVGWLGRLRRLLTRTRQESRSPVPWIIFRHGGYQAAYFLSSYNRFDPNSEYGTSLLGYGGDVLTRLGIWYDYSCMPQDAETHANLVAALERLHELLNAANLVALRQPDDNYDSRAWCAAEVAIDPDVERTRFRKICLRLDKVGDPFPPALLRQQPAHWVGIADVTLAALARAESGAEAASAIGMFIRMVGADAEDQRDFPVFFVKRKPWIFEHQQAFMTLVAKRLIQASDLDQKTEATRERFSIGVDLAKVVSDAAKSVGLGASMPGDLPYTALMILYARHRGAPDLARLFADCLVRRLNGRTTILMRYRERREGNEANRWCRFQDSGETRRPDWLSLPTSGSA